MRKLCCVFIAGWLLLHGNSPAQENPQPKDTSVALPQLEIPEITIVGKKAITLPFARKGEMFDVSIYEAPPPDTTLFGTRGGIALPIGSLPRYEEQQQPWRASLEGLFGSYTTGGLRGYIDYTTQRWGMSANGGFQATRGHTTNASGNSGQLELQAHSIVSTDNDVLKMFRASAGFSFQHDGYGMFGIATESVRRSRNHVGLNVNVGSVNRQGTVFDLSVSTKIWSITDLRIPGDSNVSVVSPDLRATFSNDMNNMRILSEIFYSGSSLNYQYQTQSPSLFGIAAGLRWHLSSDWYVQAEGIYHHSSDVSGGDKSLFAPRAIVMWHAGDGHEWSFWFQPEIHLASYDEQVRRNPYLVRDIAVRPERRPVHLGSTLVYKSEMLSLELTGSFSHSELRGIEIADSGKIILYHVNANEVVVQGDMTISPATRTRLYLSATVQPSRETGSSIQLPMVPIAKARVRGEMDFDVPLTLWSLAEYTSRRNVDRVGNETLGDAVLIGAGLSTRAFSRMVLSCEIANLFNTSYEWWKGYRGPGRQLTLEAKVNLQ